ncbi:Ger(x)C family spore germination protein [Cohnella algarum]|uniref:Ger(x)C family spore germination protein n=1 Tax=Cohnella algarum TaxID=2044859 RepID=UPI001967DE40|nr:Ger(x)C family spore germination protein [Cohnella algarum]MBN2984176.1 Ger(x)C family spore germination protein [Cohnella algarum]
MSFFAKAVLCLLLLLPLGGCWSEIDPDQITVVSAIGLDPAENGNIAVTVQLMNPTLPIAAGGGNQQRRPFAIYSANGKTIQDAVELIQLAAKKSLFFPQTQVVLIGETLARRGLDDFLDFFWREENQNFNSWTLVSRLPAKQMLENASELKAVPAEEWKAFLRGKWGRPQNVAMQMYQFLPRLNQVGFQAVSAGIGPAPNPSKKGLMEIGDAAVFRNDRMVGWLTEDESQIVNWLAGTSSKGRFLIVADGEAASMAMSSIRVRVFPVFREDRILFKIRLKGAAELKTSTMPINLAKDRGKLKKLLDEQLTEAIEKTVDKTFKTYKSDIFGFGEVIHRRHPGKWRTLKPQWNEQLESVETEIEVSFRIERAGLLK